MPVRSREAKAISERTGFCRRRFPPPDGLSLRLVKQRGGIRFAEAQIQALPHRLPCPRHYRIAGIARICRVTAHAKVARHGNKQVASRPEEYRLSKDSALPRHPPVTPTDSLPGRIEAQHPVEVAALQESGDIQ